MLFAELTSTSRRIGATRARLEKTALLAGLLRRLEPDEIDPTVAFLSGQLRQGRIGLGPAAAREAVRGTTAAAEPSLSIAEVDATFTRLAAVSGAGSAAERQRLLGALLSRATEDEREILARLVLGELRQGALEGLMAEALASASEVPAAEVRRALMLSGDLTAVARAALAEGRAGLARFHLTMFRPLQPMLAQPASSVEDALGRLGEAAFEYKLDGARVQVHRADDEVRVFTRGLHEVTAAVPELVEVVKNLPARELILDGEVLALRPDGTPHPFQTTMRRFGRKLDVEAVRAELPLTPFFFDLIRLDGSDLFDAPARERIAALGALAPGLGVPRLVTGDAEAAEAFFDEALARGHEGVMAKDEASSYEAGSRGFSWLKVKPAHTLDLVVLAVEWGNGRRTGFLSNIHLGARDAGTGAFLMIGKTFKGMTDAMLEWQTKRFQDLAVATDGYTVQLRPEQVVEVAFNDVQASPRYASGMALRLARVKRYRDDKTAAAADTIETVRAILEGRTPKSRAG
jgi:DNA ligase-1